MAQQQQQQPILMLTGPRWASDGITIANQKIKITQHTTENHTGTALWDSSFVLAKFFEKNAHLVQGKTVLEVGSGTGLLGIALHLLQVQQVTVSDMSEVLWLLEKNLQQNACQDKVQLRALNWKKAVPIDMINQFDMIVASDCVWIDDLVIPLVNTLDALVTGPNTQIYVANELRSKFTEDKFLTQMQKRGFSLTVLDPSQFDKQYSNDKISIYRFQRAN